MSERYLSPGLASASKLSIGGAGQLPPASESADGDTPIPHHEFSEQIEAALVAERRIWREEYGIGDNSTDPMALCWESPAGWPSEVPNVPRCNRHAGHAGNHICHVVWSAPRLTDEPEGAAT